NYGKRWSLALARKQLQNRHVGYYFCLPVHSERFLNTRDQKNQSYVWILNNVPQRIRLAVAWPVRNGQDLITQYLYKACRIPFRRHVEITTEVRSGYGDKRRSLNKTLTMLINMVNCLPRDYLAGISHYVTEFLFTGDYFFEGPLHVWSVKGF